MKPSYHLKDYIVNGGKLFVCDSKTACGCKPNKQDKVASVKEFTSADEHYYHKCGDCKIKFNEIKSKLSK